MRGIVSLVSPGWERLPSWRRMEFHRVARGRGVVSAAMAHPIATRDVVSSERMLVEVRFKASFELMTTPMTQMMWLVLQLARGERDASRLNPSRSAGDTGHAVDVDIGGSSALTLSPDHPVDSVSWFEVTQSIAQWNRLSEVGDDRTLELFRAVIPDFERGDTFGLPSEAQWELSLIHISEPTRPY